MKQALFYVSFDRNDFYTLIGGIKIIDLAINKEAIETEDYAVDFRIYIEESGVSKLDITTNGVFDPKLPAELYQKFYDAVRNGEALRCRLIKSKNITIEGNFLLINLDSTMPHEQQETFNLRFSSSGEFTYSFS